MHADAYAGYGERYRGAIREVACLAHVRRKFVDTPSLSGVRHRRGDHRAHRPALCHREGRPRPAARGQPPEERVRLRHAEARPILEDLEAWLTAQLPSLSGKSPLAAAIRHALVRLPRLRPYLEHGVLEIDNNAAERAMRGVALGRKNYLFVGSEAGGRAAAIACTLIETAKLNGIDPQAWLGPHPRPHPRPQDHQDRRTPAPPWLCCANQPEAGLPLTPIGVMRRAASSACRGG